MENAVKALEMAFAVMVFIMALSVSMFAFNSAKATSDVMLYAQDETNYYDYQGATGKAAENRIVGMETIVPTLYKYYKENYTVLFRQGNYNEGTGEFSNLEPLCVYNTNSTSKTIKGIQLWGKNYDNIMQGKYAPFFTNGYDKELSTYIFSFDLEEETLRHEPWTGSYKKARENLDSFLSGKKYNNPNNGESYIDYSQPPLAAGGFTQKYKNNKFVETIGEYTYSGTQASNTEENGSSINSLVKQKKKRVIIFTLIK